MSLAALLLWLAVAAAWLRAARRPRSTPARPADVARGNELAFRAEASLAAGVALPSAPLVATVTVADLKVGTITATEAKTGTITIGTTRST